MRLRMSGLLYFALVIGAVVVLLKLLHWLPLALQRDTLRTYSSIEEVRSRLNLRDIRVPSYFPQSIHWPPVRILAQSRPSAAVLMVFTRAEGREPALVIAQSAADTFPEGLFITFSEIRQKVPYEFKGKTALLEVGVDTTGEPVSRLSWPEDDLKISLIMKASPFELIRVAGSMAREGSGK